MIVQGLQGLLLHGSIRCPFAEKAHAALELGKLPHNLGSHGRVCECGREKNYGQDKTCDSLPEQKWYNEEEEEVHWPDQAAETITVSRLTWDSTSTSQSYIGLDSCMCTPAIYLRNYPDKFARAVSYQFRMNRSASKLQAVILDLRKLKSLSGSFDLSQGTCAWPSLYRSSGLFSVGLRAVCRTAVCWSVGLSYEL